MSTGMMRMLPHDVFDFSYSSSWTILRYSKNGEGYPFLSKLSTAADGLAGYQMLLMMAKLSTGLTLSSSFSTLDPKHMKQISIGVIAISVFEVQFCVFTGSFLRSGMYMWRKIEHLHVEQSDLIRNTLCKTFIFF